MEHGSRQRRAGSERDHISGLSDDLLQAILLHLRSTSAAARTSALSRRWRRVWESIPDIVLADDRIHHGASFLDLVDDASFLDTIDGALAAYAAGPAVHLRALQIVVPYKCQNIPAGHVAAWLLFASPRLAGELDLSVPMCRRRLSGPPQGEIELPPFEQAMRITLVLGNRFLLRTPPAGVFAALTDLHIVLAFMDGGALEALVSSQCPRLEKLTLLFVKLANDSDVSISSISLRHLTFNVNKTRRLDIATPNLLELCASNVDADVRVAAPNLAELVCGSIGQLVFADAVRHLRRLEVKDWSAMASSSLLRQLDTVDELRLRAPIKEEEFQRFMDDTDNLPKCETLSVSFAHNAHGPVPSVLHLLRSGGRIKKLVVLLEHRMMTADRCSLACPCRSPESVMPHSISLDSLEEIEFRLIERGNEYMEILERLLSIRSITKLKNVEVNVSVQNDDVSLSDEVNRKVRGICPSNIGVNVNVFPNGRWQNRN